MIRTVILDFDGASSAWRASSLDALRVAGGEDRQFHTVTVPEPRFDERREPGEACIACNDEVLASLRNSVSETVDPQGFVIASGIDLANMMALFAWYNDLPYPRPRLIIHYTRLPWHFAPQHRTALLSAMKDIFESWPMTYAVTTRFSAETAELAGEIKAIKGFHVDTMVTPWPLTDLDVAGAGPFLHWLMPAHLRDEDAGPLATSEDVRVLLFAPFGEFHAHHQLDATMGRMLINEGHFAHVINCDGLYVGCAADRAERYCLRCQYHHRRLFAGFDLPESMVSDWLTPAEIAAVYDWAESLDANSLLDARYGDIPAGDLALSTLLTQFNTTLGEEVMELDEVRRAHRLYLAGAVLSYMLVDRAITALRITNLLLFNGRIYPYKAALMVAKKRGIDVLVHERGKTEGSFEFYENSGVNETLKLIDHLIPWADIPLAAEELAEVSDILSARLSDKGRNWPSFYAGFTALEANFFDLLDIPRNAKIIGYFTTSPAELSLEPGYENIEAQFDIIDLLADIVADAGYYLVVRHHPAIGGTPHAPSERTGMTLTHRQQSLSTRSNLRVIMPNDPVASTALMPYLDGAIVLFSSVAVELMAAGVPTVTTPVSPLALTRDPGDPLVLSGYDQDDIRRVVGNLLTLTEQQHREYLRRCARSIYTYWSRVPVRYTAIGIRDVFYTDFNFPSYDALKPGLDSKLDVLYARLTQRTPILPTVSAGDRARSTDDEEVQLAAWMADYRSKVDARDAQRTAVQPAGAKLPELLMTDLADGPTPVDNIYGINHRWLRVGQGSVADRLVRLEALLKESSAEWVWVGSPGYRLTGAFATRIGQILRQTPAEVVALPLGGWFVVQGSIQLRYHSGDAVNKEMLADLAVGAPGLKEPLAMLGLAVWRKSVVQDLLIPAILGQGDPTDYVMTLMAALQGQAHKADGKFFFNY